MILTIKLVSLVVALILLLRLKIDLALAVFLITLYTIMLFRVNLVAALQAGGRILVDGDTLELFVIIVVVQYIGAVQKKRQLFDRLINSLNTLIRDKRIVAMVAPAIIGFLPMPGGALFSAPLVEASTKEMKLKPAFNAFLNFWFRHDWELIWPLYAGLLLFQTMSRIPLRKIILYQVPFSLLHICTGLLVACHYFRKHHIQRNRPQKNGLWPQTIRDLLGGTWPLLAVVLLYFFLPLLHVTIPLYLILVGVALLLSLYKRVTPVEAGQILFSASMLRSVLIIAAVMVFMSIIKVSAAFDILKTMHIPVAMVVLFIFLISFTIGYLTGVNTAYIAIAFPILQPLIQSLPHPLFLYLYMYVIGFAGILASPLHLCLVLTNEYFQTSLLAVYRYMAFPLLSMMGLSTVLVLILGR